MDYKEYERLRKTTISFLEDFAKQGYENAVECIDWLESLASKPQSKSALEAIKEEKVDNANCIKPTEDKLNFNIGQWVVRKDGDTFTDGRKTVQITKIDKEQYWFDCETWLEAKDIRLWTIQDAKDGDVLVDVYGNIGIYEKHGDFDWVSYCSLGHYGGFQHFKLEHENEGTYPATEEQRNLLFEKIKEAGYEWDAENKRLIKRWGIWNK